jgi:hypothetical protein
MGLNLTFNDSDWERIKRDWSGWWARALDRPMVVIEGKEPQPGVEYPEVSDFKSNYPLEMSPQEVLALFEPHLEATRWYGDAFPKWTTNFGPGIVAGFLGAKVHIAPWTVWFGPAQDLELKDVRPCYDPTNRWWVRIRSLTAGALERWQGNVSISHTDLGGNLDILASLRGTQRLLVDLYDVPEEVERLTEQITHLWLRYYRELRDIIRSACWGTTPWAPIWSPGTTYMLQSDISAMFSPAMFERFVLPDLTTCCEYLDHGFYHLDGPGAIQHLDILLAMPRLCGIQWVPTDRKPGSDEWLPLLKRIIDGGKLCQVYVTAEEALNIVRNLGGKGFALYITEQLSGLEAEALLRQIAADDISQGRRWY